MVFREKQKKAREIGTRENKGRRYLGAFCSLNREPI
jgi:hypothetical protein